TGNRAALGVFLGRGDGAVAGDGTILNSQRRRPGGNAAAGRSSGALGCVVRNRTVSDRDIAGIRVEAAATVPARVAGDAAVLDGDTPAVIRAGDSAAPVGRVPAYRTFNQSEQRPLIVDTPSGSR